MNYKLNLGVWNGIFCVPNAVVDSYIKLAGENDIKVLLCLLRNSGNSLDEMEISSFLGISGEEIEESVKFWEQRGIIKTLGTDELIPAPNDSLNSVREIDNSDKKVPAVNPSLVSAPEFSPQEIADAVNSNEKMKYLFKHCEKLYNRPLKPNEQKNLMLITNDIGLSAEAALILINYCFSINKTSPAYMRTIAAEWIESEITTIEKAEQRVVELKARDSAINRFKIMFEVNSTFSSEQKKLINKWANEYSLSDGMIAEAYNITLDRTGKLSFKYMDKLISNWHENGISSPEQLEVRQGIKNKEKISQDKINSSIDLDLIQRKLIEKRKKSGENK